MKRPAFQFYPADWRNDPGLKLCSLSARGLWIEMLCVMHMAQPYGHLCAAGRPLTPKDYSKFFGDSARNISKFLQELLDNGVCSKTKAGVIFSRRMVRDEKLRNVRAAGGEAGKEFGKLGAEHGKKGGRPRKETGDSKPPLKPAPSSALASASSSSTAEDQNLHRARQDSQTLEPENPQPPTEPELARATANGVCARALNALGHTCTPHTPAIVAYASAGGTPEHLQAVAAFERCRGKNGAYVAQAALDELTTPANPGTSHAQARPALDPISRIRAAYERAKRAEAG